MTGQRSLGRHWAEVRIGKLLTRPLGAAKQATCLVASRTSGEAPVALARVSLRPSSAEDGPLGPMALPGKYRFS